MKISKRASVVLAVDPSRSTPKEVDLPVSQPSSSSEITEAKKLADHAKDVLARGYIDLEGFAKGVVELSAELSSLKDSQLTSCPKCGERLNG